MDEREEMEEESADKSKEFVQFMSEHLVVYAVEVTSYEDGKVLDETIVALSGVIIEIFDRWLWVTAGHCLKMLDGEENNTLTLRNGGFLDCFGRNPKSTHAIPYTYDPSEREYIEEPDLGLDFGIIPLTDLFRQQMAANGIQPIRRNHWTEQVGLDFEHYKMLGIPVEQVFVQKDPSGRLVGKTRPVLFLDRSAQTTRRKESSPRRLVRGPDSE